MTTWADLAQMPAGDMKAPPLLPRGHYSAFIGGQPECGLSSKKQTPQAVYPLRLTEALEDVDADELSVIENPFAKEREITFYLTANAGFMLTDLARALGAPVDNQTVTETVEWLGNCQEPIVVRADHESNERNPDRPFLRFNDAVAMTVWEEQQARRQQA